MRTMAIRAAMVLSTVAALSMAACTASKPPNTARPGSGHTVPPTASPRTAAQDLASFFAAAQQDDMHLRAAAALVNSGITNSGMSFSQATLAAVQTADPLPVAAAIPAGLDPTLIQPTLLVYSELLSRYEAMSHIPVGVITDGGDTASTYQRYVRCLGNGAAAASRFPADLAGLEKLASTAPAVTIAPPDSRAAAELALRIADIGEANAGCASCGGKLATTLATIAWGWQGTWSGMGTWSDGSAAPPDGTINGSTPFHVSYQAGKGWFAQEYVC